MECSSFKPVCIRYAIEMTEHQAKNQDTLQAASRALFKLGRRFARQQSALSEAELSGILVAQAVAESSDQQPNIAQIAKSLEVEHSTASRLVSRAQKAGIVNLQPAAEDARVRVLSLTENGETLAQQAWDWQQDVFLRLTQDWTEAERQNFAEQFLRFAAALEKEMGE